MYGVDGDYFDMFPIRITEGRKLAENELNSTHQVVMINEAARDELFPDGDALHKNIEMNGVPFKVAGVFKEKDQQESMFEGDYANPVLYVPKKCGRSLKALTRQRRLPCRLILLSISKKPA